MSNSVAPAGAETPPPFWTTADKMRIYDLMLNVNNLTQSAYKIAEMSSNQQPQAAAIADFLDQAAHFCLRESEHIRERLPFVASIGGSVIQGTQEEIDDILDGLDDPQLGGPEGGAR